jgi:vitamin K-dependent gamma-carboxylase
MRTGLRTYLWQEIDISSLVWFRVVFGVLGFVDLCGGFFYYHLYEESFRPDRFQFKYYGFEWVPVLPEPWMSLFFVIGLALALAVAFGYHYRRTAPAFAVVVTWYFLLEKAHYLNHGYFFCWLAWAMAFLPAWRHCSYDTYRQPVLRSETTPRWTLGVLLLLMGVVYFFGGIAKLNAAWLGRAMPLQLWLQSKAELWLIGPLLAKEATAWFMAWGGAAFDLSITFLLLWQRTRLLGLALVLFFHFTNLFVFNIGIFPWLSIALSTLFFASSWPREWIQHLAGQWPWLGRWRIRFLKGSPKRAFPLPARPFWQRYESLQPVILLSLSLLLALHIFLPLRHHLFSGDVAWTEEGHRYAWRMMLRAKQGNGHFVIQDLQTGGEEHHRPTELRSKQERKLWTHPDMILQYAHHLRDQAAAAGREVAVYARIRIRLNDGEYHPFIDPRVDLAKVKWSYWRTKPWVLAEGASPD